jgi:hypothetical protein
MSEYMDNINPDSYRNNAKIYVQEVIGQNREFIPLKLTLDSSNFNFNTAKQDGSDLRFTETQNGINVLQMWVAYWDYSARKATVWLKLPFLLANETKVLHDDLGSSNLKYMLGESVISGSVSTPVFLFGDDFNDSVLDPNKWSGSGDFTISDSELNLGIDSYIQSPEVFSEVSLLYINNPIELTIHDGLTSGWAVPHFDGVMYPGVGFLHDGVINTPVDQDHSCFGFDLDDVKYNIKEVLVYARTLSDAFTITGWDPIYKPHVILYVSDTNNDGDYTEIGTYYWYDLPIVYIDGYVCAFKISFPAPGRNFRYLAMEVCTLAVNSGYLFIYLTEFEVFRQDVSNITIPAKWIIEEGIICNPNYTSNSYYAHRYDLRGGENEFKVQYYANTKLNHNIEYGGDVVNYYGTNRGLESGSYSQNYIAYYEETDKVYQGMSNRDTFINYDDELERKVNRNTNISHFRIYGENHSDVKGVKIDWLIVREYNQNSDPEVDVSELYIPYENIPHQPLDFTEYTSDVTSVDYYHSSNMAGDPYKMSDNITNSISNIFVSNTTTSGNLIIDFGRKKTNLVDDWYLHLDNNHVNYYNASKLSDLDEDIYNRNYWQCTTSSGVWAAIKFPSPIMVGCLSVTAVAANLDGMIKDFKFYGCNTDPRFAEVSEKYLLAEGIFSRVSTEQTVYFTTTSRIFNYYILEANSSYGNNIALQEWGMYELRSDTSKKVISQLRLHPVAFESNESYFPKEVKFYGSNNMTDWVKLIDTTKTYTPFIDATYGRWQRYSFDNNVAYYNYKVVCVDNWYAQYDIIKIAEWEMVMETTEENTFRILDGSLDNINNIWADNTATFEDGNIYITNDRLSVVMHNTLIESTTVSGLISDMNIRV